MHIFDSQNCLPLCANFVRLMSDRVNSREGNITMNCLCMLA